MVTFRLCITALLLLSLNSCLQDREKRAIRKQTKELAALCERAGEQRTLREAANSARFTAFFIEEASVTLRQYSISLDGADELKNFYAYVMRTADHIESDFAEQSLELGERRRTARQVLFASFDIRSGEERVQDEFRFIVDWIKLGGEWVISSVEENPVLEAY